jgi:uncharacterized protein YlxP (DUF503 family)
MINMEIATITFRLHAPWVHSLKEKRMIVKSKEIFTLRKEAGKWKLTSSKASTY